MAMPVVTADTVADLPAPVGRCLRNSGVVGTEIPTSVLIRQEGQIRPDVNRRWMKFSAVEQYAVDRPGFEWVAKLRMAGIGLGRAVDSLAGGRGGMNVRLLGMFTVVDASGPEMDQGALLRWLNETMWFPAVWATDLIGWDSIDDTSALGSVAVGDLSVQAEFRFDRNGRFVDFRADRYRDVGGAFEIAPWSTPISEHAVFNGIEVPAAGSALWHLEDRDIEYIQLRVDDISYRGRPTPD